MRCRRKKHKQIYWDLKARAQGVCATNPWMCVKCIPEAVTVASGDAVDLREKGDSKSGS
jgi:hypothetical protein